MLWLSDIRIPAEEASVRQARDLVAAVSLTLPLEVQDDLRLLTSEVATNAVRHGTPRTSGQNGTIRVRIGRGQRCIRVEVHDHGAGFEHALRGPDSELGSGWGVHFVDHCAERWGMGHEPDGWVVWFELAVAPQGDTTGTARDRRHAGPQIQPGLQRPARECGGAVLSGSFRRRA